MPAHINSWKSALVTLALVGSFLFGCSKANAQTSLRHLPQQKAQSTIATHTRGTQVYSPLMGIPGRSASIRNGVFGVKHQGLGLEGKDYVFLGLVLLGGPVSLIMDIVGVIGLKMATGESERTWGVYGVIAGSFGILTGSGISAFVFDMASTPFGRESKMDMIALMILGLTLACNIPLIVSGVRAVQRANGRHYGMGMRPWIEFTKEGKARGGMMFSGSF